LIVNNVKKQLILTHFLLLNLNTFKELLLLSEGLRLHVLQMMESHAKQNSLFATHQFAIL